MWNYVTFLRNNSDKLELLLDYIQSMKMKYNVKIMKIVDVLCNVPTDGSEYEVTKYNRIIENIIKEIEDNNTKNKLIKEREKKENSSGDSSLRKQVINSKDYAF